MDTESEADKARDHEQRLVVIKSRAEAFAKSPVWFTVWDLTGTILKIIFWLGFWSIIAQCECSGCIWGKP
jgi:hypothetical protein